MNFINIYKLKNFKISIFLILTHWLLFSCVDLFNANLNTNIRKLVVDGEISNKPGPYTVILQQSSPFGTSDFSPPPPSAIVSISDNLGNTETLSDMGNGKFETNSTQGVIGRTYVLEIKLDDKKVYQSTPQTIKKPIPIDKIYTEYMPYKGYPNVFIGGEFHAYLDTIDPATNGDYYRWNYTNYDPVEYCLETSQINVGGRDSRQYICSEPCWAINYCAGCIYLGSDQYNNGKKINRQFIGKFPYNTAFSTFLQIEQKSLTKENYFYWKEIDSQINNSGGIFDTPPANIQGNIYSETDPNEQVLGFFAATGIVTVPYRVEKKADGFNPVIPSRLNFITQKECKPCTEGLYRTQIKPIGY